ncbi:hypothetical protein JOE31_001384 [Arthrobacter sp. PvP023]|uniref:hypothetical protein n=1 Tax=Micrococcaceae TaxID=1268 RepID=UPI001AEAE554|nr:hypothetical protein [Arthrobacter sp. PvP023]MBP1135152.1 hypothetical protein [Arthrobacter sp. PvP023]
MESIRSLIAAAERDSRLPEGEDERFTGYGIMGQPFSSGYLLALRRFSATSVGPGYTAIWLRRPSGAWIMYTDVPADVSCPRYFGSALEATSVHRIDVAWLDDHRFTVDIADDVGLHWEVSLAATPVTRAMSALASALPAKLWGNPAFLRVMGAVAGPSLQAGRIGLVGRVPNGQGFRANPRRMWFISGSTATLQGEDLGSLQALPVQTRLGDFWIPQRGIFMMGSSRFDAFDPAAHHALPGPPG